MPELIPCLKLLFEEFNHIAPFRSKTSDGWIGDTSHKSGSSDHNPDETGKTPEHDADTIDEVHAIDVDSALHATFTTEAVVQYFITECRKLKGNDRGRLKYIIYNRRIWEAPSWVQQPYRGPSPHTEHIHFSAEYATANESDTTTWGLVSKFGGTEVSLPKKGDSGEDVRYWQLMHNNIRKVFNPPLAEVTADGSYGPSTQTAFHEFWKAVGGTGKYDGSYLHAWVAVNYNTTLMHLIADVQPAPEISPTATKQLKALVNDLIKEYLAEENKGKVPPL